MENLIPGTGERGGRRGPPARAPELLVKLNLLHCLMRAECVTLEPAVITRLFPTSFPEQLKSPFFSSLPLPPSPCPWSTGLLVH